MDAAQRWHGGPSVQLESEMYRLLDLRTSKPKPEIRIINVTTISLPFYHTYCWALQFSLARCTIENLFAFCIIARLRAQCGRRQPGCCRYPGAGVALLQSWGRRCKVVKSTATATKMSWLFCVLWFLCADDIVLKNNNSLLCKKEDK